jgi:hypothetical protein
MLVGAACQKSDGATKDNLLQQAATKDNPVQHSVRLDA